MVISASALQEMQDVIEGKDYSFPKQEEQVLKFWDDTQAFQQQLKRSEGKKPYVFYDGPPFATGLPHYGHLLAGTLKVPRLACSIVLQAYSSPSLSVHCMHRRQRGSTSRMSCMSSRNTCRM